MISLYKSKFNKSKYGYTLSEVLVVVAIIGVVFTLALGTVFADINKNRTAIQLKQFYSILSNAFVMQQSKTGMPSSWDVPDTFSEESSYNVFKDILKPNLMIARDCKNSTTEQCDFNFKELDGTEKSLNSTWNRFFLNNGMFVATQYVVDPNYKVIYIYADVNGKKRLNVTGRDIFMFEYHIQNDLNPDYVGQLNPYGHEYSRDVLVSDSNTNNCNPGQKGNYCAAVIMKDEWDIKPGYPWAQARYVVK